MNQKGAAGILPAEALPTRRRQHLGGQVPLA